jgi:hypothetical protein
MDRELARALKLLTDADGLRLTRRGLAASRSSGLSPDRPQRLVRLLSEALVYAPATVGSIRP